MSKISKRALKGLIKECLIEILTEGLAETPLELQESVASHASYLQEAPVRRTHQQKLARPRSAALDSPVVSGRTRVKKNPNFEDNVSRAVNQLTNDPLLSEILNDTARGSLQRLGNLDPSMGSTSIAPGSELGHNPTAGPQLDGDPSQIFESVAPGSSEKWAHLAFAAPKRHLPGQMPG